MGVPLSTTIFSDLDLDLESKIQIPIVIYQGLQLAFGSILVPIFRRWIDSTAENSSDKPNAASEGSSGIINERRTNEKI